MRSTEDMVRGAGASKTTLTDADRAEVTKLRAEIKSLQRKIREAGGDADTLGVVITQKQEKIAQVFNGQTDAVATDETAAIAAVRRLAETARNGVQVEASVVVSHLYRCPPSPSSPENSKS